MAQREAYTLLRIYLGELDKVDGTPLFEAIVQTANRSGLAGATVLRGVESFGGTHEVHTAKVLRLSEALPLVVDIVDRPEKIEAFLPVLEELLERSGGGGLATLQPVEAMAFPPKGKG